jgi:hypothetical protein
MATTRGKASFRSSVRVYCACTALCILFLFKITWVLDACYFTFCLGLRFNHKKSPKPTPTKSWSPSNEKRQSHASCNGPSILDYVTIYTNNVKYKNNFTLKLQMLWIFVICKCIKQIRHLPLILAKKKKKSEIKCLLTFLLVFSKVSFVDSCGLQNERFNCKWTEKDVEQNVCEVYNIGVLTNKQQTRHRHILDRSYSCSYFYSRLQATRNDHWLRQVTHCAALFHCN